MDTILVVNAGSSSLKFQVFGIEASANLKRLIKGQIEGIGTRPRLRATGANGASAIDKTFLPEQVRDLPAAIQETAIWLRSTQNFELKAVGHRVVHGGPEYSSSVLINADVVSRLNATSLWHRSTSLTTWLRSVRFSRGVRKSRRSLVSILHFIAATVKW
jgi:acetate kinase